MMAKPSAGSRLWLLALSSVVLVPAWVVKAEPRTSAYAQEALGIYRAIVAIPTVEGRGETPRAAEYLATRFRAAGFGDGDIEIVRTGNSAGLMVHYRGSGQRRPILLLAHMDVVEARREDWQRDPFTLAEENGYFIGRGASDNKFDVAQLVAGLIQLRREGFQPDRDLILLISGDEETGGFVNTRALLERVRPLRPEYALNSDSGGGILQTDGTPEAYVIQVAEKTYATFEVTVTNAGGHSSAPRVDNAIAELSAIMTNVHRFSFPVMASEVTRDFFRRAGQSEPGELGAAMRAFAADPHDQAAIAILSAVPAHSTRLRTTCVPTRLRAGHADNALPQSATATINCRIFPGETIASVQAQLAQAGGNPSAQWRVSDQSPESGFSPRNPAIEAALETVVHQRFPGIPINSNMSAAGTDAVHFRAAGIPTYGVSANFTKPNDSFQHGLNERALVDSFFGGLDHWPALIRALASRHP